MKVGVIGSGGREHAICISLKKSKNIDKIYCFPGNAGTSFIAENIEIELNNFEEISIAFFMKINLSLLDSHICLFRVSTCYQFLVDLHTAPRHNDCRSATTT